jgi:carbon monoxide dehydrogenase subunit G
MGSATTEITIDRPADDVWKLVAEFGGLAEWMPGVDSCVVEGDDRRLSMMGMQIVERLVRRDDDTRTLSYSIVGGDLSVEHHEATITVSPAGDGSHVTWSVDVAPDSLVDVMSGAYDGALKSLKQKAES